MLKLPETKCVTIRKKAPLLSSSRQMGEDRRPSGSFGMQFVRRPVAGLLQERKIGRTPTVGVGQPSIYAFVTFLMNVWCVKYCETCPTFFKFFVAVDVSRSANDASSRFPKIAFGCRTTSIYIRRRFNVLDVSSPEIVLLRQSLLPHGGEVESVLERRSLPSTF